MSEKRSSPAGGRHAGVGGALSRRHFVSGAAGAATLMVHSSLAAAEETRDLRLGVIGCGGRGSGAINDSLTINEGVRLVATADLFAPKCAALWKAMREAHPAKVAATESIAAGLDGWIGDLISLDQAIERLDKVRALRAGKGLTMDGFTVLTPLNDAFLPEHYERAEAAGITGILTMPWVFYSGPDASTADKIEGMRRFRKDLHLDA
jgi:hypothetical protein